ncbi:hypothetical protein TNCV_899241 [Trichonephila clavipes]|nr:hypothetical protein TNCV_899241 [Trichonephila clavipes]
MHHCASLSGALWPVLPVATPGEIGYLHVCRFCSTLPWRSKSSHSFGHSLRLAHCTPDGYYYRDFYWQILFAIPCSMLICHPHAAYYQLSEFVSRLRHHQE